MLNDPTEVDAERLAAKTLGANVVDLAAYRAASAATSDTGTTYVPPNFFLIIGVVLIVLAILAFIGKGRV